MIGAFAKRKINSIHSSDALTRNVRPMGGHVEYMPTGQTNRRTDARPLQLTLRFPLDAACVIIIVELHVDLESPHRRSHRPLC